MRHVCFLLVAALAQLCSCKLQPTHVILTLADELSSMQVSFTTTTEPKNSSVTFWQTSTISPILQIFAKPEDVHPFKHATGTDYITSITMTSLLSGTEYTYYVSGSANDTSTNSPKYTFKTIPSEIEEIKIGIYGDLGAYGAGIMEKGRGGLTYWAQNRLFDFIIHNGDLAYNLGSGAGRKGREFLDNVEPLTSTIPYIVTPGNHEFIDDSEEYYKGWFVGQTLLGQKSNSSYPLMFYSFDVGYKLHVIVISTEIYCEDRDYLRAQYAWLENDLVSVSSRKVKPWIIALGHRQMYMGYAMSFHGALMRLGLQCNDSSLKYCDFEPCNSGKNCGFSIETLFNRYDVDIYYSGHMHLYNRMYPIGPDLKFEKQETAKYVNPQCPVYIVSGAAGAENAPPKEEGLRGPNDTTPSVSIDSTGHSFTRLTLTTAKHLRHEQINISDGSVVDTFEIVRDDRRKAWDKTTPLTLHYDGEIVCDQ